MIAKGGQPMAVEVLSHLAMCNTNEYFVDAVGAISCGQCNKTIYQVKPGVCPHCMDQPIYQHDESVCPECGMYYPAPEVKI